MVPVIAMGPVSKGEGISKEDALEDEVKSRSHPLSFVPDRNKPVEIPELSCERILESFCKNLRALVQDDPEKLLLLKQQMRNMMKHYRATEGERDEQHSF